MSTVNPTTLHHVDELDLNFTQAKKIAATKIDHTFKTANDLWEMTITHPQQALSVSLCSINSGCRFIAVKNYSVRDWQLNL